LPLKRAGITKSSSKMQKKNDTEFSRELSEKNQKNLEKSTRETNKSLENPGYYGIYPGE